MEPLHATSLEGATTLAYGGSSPMLQSNCGSTFARLLPSTGNYVGRWRAKAAGGTNNGSMQQNEGLIAATGKARGR